MDRYKFALDRIELIDKAKTPEKLVAELARTAEQFGFDACAVAALPHPSVPFEQSIFAHKWPPGWYHRYISQGYDAVDPVLRHVNTTPRPFEWAEARYDAVAQPKSAAMMNEAADFGLAVGFCVPTYTARGEIVNVTFGGRRCEFSREDRGILQLVAIYAQTRVTELVAGKLEVPSLSPREREILKWCSAGKTTDEIAEILSISPHTVLTHISGACRKLDVSSRTAAVARAMHARLI